MQKDLKQELAKYKRKAGLQERTPCSGAENKQYLEILNQGGQLPDSIGRYELVHGGYLDKFFIMHDSNLTKEEQQEYIQLKMLDMQSQSAAHLRTIKKCVLFFTVPAVISLVLSLIVFVAAFCYDFFSAFL